MDFYLLSDIERDVIRILLENKRMMTIPDIFEWFDIDEYENLEINDVYDAAENLCRKELLAVKRTDPGPYGFDYDPSGDLFGLSWYFKHCRKEFGF